MTAKLEVRPIAGQELDEALPLIAAYQRFYRAEPDVERNRRFFSRFLHPSKEGLLLGAWLDGALAGFATLYWFFSSTKVAESVLMNDLFVREDLRGAGVGRALIDGALDEARRRGAAHLEWFTAPDNLVAQRLYDSMAGAQPSMWRAYEIDVGGPTAKPPTSDQAPGEETVQVNDQYKGGGPAASPGPREHAQHQTGG
ncbi:MAG TPA: GNAT family N-acetyltransferase [Candidatus Dormibacteraeota bacterium]|nr:GNAT family N-acetyltransferase [Candidatus Dormibacteraeota bacterium]